MVDTYTERVQDLHTATNLAIKKYIGTILKELIIIIFFFGWGGVGLPMYPPTKLIGQFISRKRERFLWIRL